MGYQDEKKVDDVAEEYEERHVDRNHFCRLETDLFSPIKRYKILYCFDVS